MLEANVRITQVSVKGGLAVVRYEMAEEGMSGHGILRIPPESVDLQTGTEMKLRFGFGSPSGTASPPDPEPKAPRRRRARQDT